MAKKGASPVSLSVMLGTGEKFIVGDKEYTVKPLKLKDLDEFTSDKLAVDAQLFNVMNKEARANLDKWLQKQVVDAEGNPVDYNKIMEDDWTLADLRRCIGRLLDISG